MIAQQKYPSGHNARSGNTSRSQGIGSGSERCRHYRPKEQRPPRNCTASRPRSKHQHDPHGEKSEGNEQVGMRKIGE